jgi:hypothetical protein
VVVAERVEAAAAEEVAVAVAERERLDFPILAAPAAPVVQAATVETGAPDPPEGLPRGAVLVVALSRSSHKGG